LYFPQLSNFETVATLLDAVIPYFETNSAGTAKLTGRNAAHVMNKLKAMRRPQARSEAGPVANAERKRVEGALVRLMHIVSAKMDELALKHLALVLNAVKGSRGSAEAELVKTACSHAVKLLEQETQHTQDGQPPSVTAQPVAMLLNSLAMGAGGFSATAGASKTAADARPTHPQALGNADVVEPVFEASTRVLLAMPQDFFDAQSISTIMNAYASAGRWNLALFRRLGTMAVALAPERWTLQPVAMVVNAYSRLMEQEHVLSPWDVQQVDVQLFQGMSSTTTFLAGRLKEPSGSTAHSVALIVNALAKVGVNDKHIFVAVSQLLRRAPAGAQAGSLLRYDAQAVSNILNAFAKANVRDELLFEELARVAMRLPMNSFSGQHVATILNAYTRVGISNEELFEHMSSLLRYWDRFGQLTPSRVAPQAVALILNAFARAKIDDRDLFERMARLVQLHLHSPLDGPLDLVPSSSPAAEVSQPLPAVATGGQRESMSPQAVSNIVNACANGNFKAPQLLNTLEKAIMAFDGSAMSLQHVSCIANGMVRLGQAPAPLLEHLTKLARSMSPPSPADPSGPLSLSLLANALCKSEVSDEESFRWIAEQARRYEASAFSGQSVAMLANSFARAGRRDHALFRQLCDVCMSLEPEAFDEQSIANIANAFARNSQAWTKHADAAPGSYNRLTLLFQRLAKIATRPEMWAFSSQSVALIVNAYAKLGIKDAVLFDRLSQVARQMGSRNFELPCKPLHVAQVCNAFAKAHVHDEPLFRRMSELVQGQAAADFDARLIGIIFNAYAQLSIRDLALEERLSSVARSMPSSSFDAQAIGNIFHALAALDIRDDPLIDHMATTILRSRQTIMQMQDYNGQALANIAWSIAVLQLSDVALNRWICRMCAERINSMDTNALRQLHQYILAHEVEGLVKREQLPELDEVLKYRSRIQRAWDQHQRNMLSNRQRSASSQLSSLTPTDVADDVSNQELELGDAVESDPSEQDADGTDHSHGSVPVWMGEDEHGAAGWLELRIQRNSPGMPADQSGEVDQERQPGQIIMQQGSKVDALNDDKDQQFVGMSNLQRDVAKTLRSLIEGRALKATDATSSGAISMLELADARSGQDAQAIVQEEVTEKITSYSMDMMVLGSSLVIEVDGPSHYARGTRVPLGSTVMKRRQLSAVGYRLCSVPFWQWPTGMTRAEKTNVLASLLAPYVKGVQGSSLELVGNLAGEPNGLALKLEGAGLSGADAGTNGDTGGASAAPLGTAANQLPQPQASSQSRPKDAYTTGCNVDTRCRERGVDTDEDDKQSDAPLQDSGSSDSSWGAVDRDAGPLLPKPSRRF